MFTKDVRHHVKGQWTLRNGKQMRWTLLTVQAYCLELPSCGSMCGNPGRGMWTPAVEDMEGRSGEMKVASSHRRVLERRELLRGRTWRFADEAPCRCSSLMISAHMWRKPTEAVGKNHPKGLKVPVPMVTQGQNSTYSHHLDGKLNMHGGLLTRILPQYWEITGHRLITALIPPNKSEKQTQKNQTVSKLFNYIIGESSRIFIGIQKYPALNKVKFTMFDSQ